MSARDELALVLANAQRFRNGSSMLPSADHVSRLALDDADAVLAAGYRKPTVLGYLVVSRDGTPMGEAFSDRLTAQARADEWTNDCRVGGVDWDYSVTEIVEATP